MNTSLGLIKTFPLDSAKFSRIDRTEAKRKELVQIYRAFQNYSRKSLTGWKKAQALKCLRAIGQMSNLSEFRAGLEIFDEVFNSGMAKMKGRRI